MRRLVATALLFLALAGASRAMAGQVQVAVAANFLDPAREIAAAYTAQTGDKVVLSPGSSGQLYVQLAHGAPYQVFLSADSEQPARAEATGLAVKGSRFTYAVGRLVLYSRKPDLVDGQGAVLARGSFSKLAIADPATAPYGRAAVEVLKKRGIYEQVRPKLVTGVSITQAYQFVETGAADLGLVALSQVIRKPGGSRWLVPTGFHAPIIQQAVLLKTGEQDPAARRFMAFLKSRQARTIMASYGYGLP